MAMLLGDSAILQSLTCLPQGFDRVCACRTRAQYDEHTFIGRLRSDHAGCAVRLDRLGHAHENIGAIDAHLKTGQCIKTRRLKLIPRREVKAGVVPRAYHTIAAQSAFDERHAIRRAIRHGRHGRPH
jgi:hypothetical protein